MTTPLPAFCAAMGRVLLSGLAEPELNAWLDSCKAAPLTPHTVTEPHKLRRIVAEVGRQGYAYVEQELEEGLCSLAVPIVSARGETIAALNAGMAFRAGARSRALKDVLPVLQAAARQIEAALPASPASAQASA